jgi:hypothetical protein
MTTQPITRIAALLAATTTLVGAFVACGDSITNNANCGAGTRLENGTCVAIPPDATTPVTDGGEEVDSGTTDAGPADTGPDLNAEDPTPDDPCPVKEGPRHYIFNCDAKCGAVDPLCDANFCTRDGSLRPIESMVTTAPQRIALMSSALTKQEGAVLAAIDKVTVRLPRNAASTLTCVTPTGTVAATDGGAPTRALPRFMMFLPLAWQRVTNLSFKSISTDIPQYLRIRARGFDLQSSHSSLIDPRNNLHFDRMPTATSAPVGFAKGCLKIDRKALVYSQVKARFGELVLEASYEGFAGIYVSSDWKLAATNVEIDAGNDANDVWAIPARAVPDRADSPDSWI